MIGQLFDQFGVVVFPACVFGFATLMGCSFLLLSTRPVFEQDPDVCKAEHDLETEELISSKNSNP